MMPLYFINDTAEKKALSGINLQQQRGPLRLPVAVFNVTLPASPSKRQITPLWNVALTEQFAIPPPGILATSFPSSLMVGSARSQSCTASPRQLGVAVRTTD